MTDNDVEYEEAVSGEIGARYDGSPDLADNEARELLGRQPHVGQEVRSALLWNDIQDAYLLAVEVDLVPNDPTRLTPARAWQVAMEKAITGYLREVGGDPNFLHALSIAIRGARLEVTNGVIAGVKIDWNLLEPEQTHRISPESATAH